MDAAWLVGIGVAIGWCVRLPEVWHLRQLLAESDADARDATDRLIAAWREGYHVPESVTEDVPLDPLPTGLAALLDDYPDPAARAKVEAAIRRKMHAGRSADAIIMDAEVGQL